MITKKQLEEAPPWTVFNGPAEDPGPIGWALFALEEMYLEDVCAKMEELGVFQEHPEWDSDAPQPHANVDDLDAALAYLCTGGTLCKVPDTMDSSYWRLLVVERQEAGDKNHGGTSMIVQRTPELLAAAGELGYQVDVDLRLGVPLAIYGTGVSGRRLSIHLRETITRKEDPVYFPPVYDPAIGRERGERIEMPSGIWERFSTQSTSVMAPTAVLDLIRKAHPGCTWQLVGLSLFGVLPDLRVIAIASTVGDW
jgi:hypothetical protein